MDVKPENAEPRQALRIKVVEAAGVGLYKDVENREVVEFERKLKTPKPHNVSFLGTYQVRAVVLNEAGSRVAVAMK